MGRGVGKDAPGGVSVQLCAPGDQAATRRMRVNDRESATSCWALRARHGADLRPEPCRLRLHQGQGLTTTLTRKPNLLALAFRRDAELTGASTVKGAPELGR